MIHTQTVFTYHCVDFLFTHTHIHTTLWTMSSWVPSGSVLPSSCISGTKEKPNSFFSPFSLAEIAERKHNEDILALFYPCNNLVRVMTGSVWDILNPSQHTHTHIGSIYREINSKKKTNANIAHANSTPVLVPHTHTHFLIPARVTPRKTQTKLQNCSSAALQSEWCIVGSYSSNVGTQSVNETVWRVLEGHTAWWALTSEGCYCGTERRNGTHPAPPHRNLSTRNPDKGTDTGKVSSSIIMHVQYLDTPNLS